MKVEQIYTGCLAQGAYYIESEGEVAIVDPLREVDPYIKKAEAEGARIKYVLETHFHADFVSGHLDLSQKTGASIVFGPNAAPSFPIHAAKDGEILSLGNIKIKVLHTPGHTMESTCYLLMDEEGKEKALFSGDTLFIGDVGRPDLAQKVKAELTEDILAGHLYDSLRNKIMPLADDIIVYPAHGAGSACGKKMSKETTDTLGHQKRTNYALDPALGKERFQTAQRRGGEVGFRFGPRQEVKQLPRLLPGFLSNCWLESHASASRYILYELRFVCRNYAQPFLVGIKGNLLRSHNYLNTGYR